MSLFLEHYSRQGTIIMSDYPGVQEWDGAINLLLDRELDGGLNGVDVLMELFDVIP